MYVTNSYLSSICLNDISCQSTTLKLWKKWIKPSENPLWESLMSTMKGCYTCVTAAHRIDSWRLLDSNLFGWKRKQEWWTSIEYTNHCAIDPSLSEKQVAMAMWPFGQSEAAVFFFFFSSFCSKLGNTSVIKSAVCLRCSLNMESIAWHSRLPVWCLFCLHVFVSFTVTVSVVICSKLATVEDMDNNTLFSN